MWTTQLLSRGVSFHWSQKTEWNYRHPSLRDRSRVVPRSDRACVFTERSVVKMQTLRNRIESAYSGPKLPPIPDECCHPFHFKAATDSGECCHPLVMMF